jgi:hypothetical protein
VPCYGTNKKQVAERVHHPKRHTRYWQDKADEKHCTFHVTLPASGEEITDIAMINTGDREIEFKSGNFVTTSITTANEA